MSRTDSERAFNFTPDGEHLAPGVLVPGRTAALAALYNRIASNGNGMAYESLVREHISRATDGVIGFTSLRDCLAGLREQELIDIDESIDFTRLYRQQITLLREGRKEMRAIRFALMGALGMARFPCDSRDAARRRFDNPMILQRPAVLAAFPEGAHTMTDIRDRLYMATNHHIWFSRTTMDAAVSDLLEYDFLREAGSRLTGGRPATQFCRTTKGGHEAGRIKRALQKLIVSKSSR